MDLKRPKRWVTAIPLRDFSSLHEVSLLGIANISSQWAHFFMQFDCNINTPMTIHPKAYITFHFRDEGKLLDAPNFCYSFTNLKRWRLDISRYRSFEDFIMSSKRWYRCTYEKAAKLFKNYGCSTSIIENDWSEYAKEAYQLYANVASKHGNWIFDLNFFETLAKRGDSKLFCAWYEDKMIAVFVVQPELSVLHSIVCGLDYIHSRPSFCYSWLHYLVIKYGIEKKYKIIEAGMTEDRSKGAIGFEAIPCSLDIHSKGMIVAPILRFISKFTSATITSDAKVKFRLKNPFK